MPFAGPYGFSDINVHPLDGPAQESGEFHRGESLPVSDVLNMVSS